MLPLSDSSTATLSGNREAERSRSWCNGLVAFIVIWALKANQASFDITSRPMSDNVLRFSTTASCGSIVIWNWSSRNVTTLSTAMESRIPVVISGVVSVNAAGSSPGRYSFKMKDFTLAWISCSFMNDTPVCGHDGRLCGCGHEPYLSEEEGIGDLACNSGTRPSYSLSANRR